MIDAAARHYLPWAPDNTRALHIKSMLDGGQILGATVAVKNATMKVVKKIV